MIRNLLFLILLFTGFANLQAAQTQIDAIVAIVDEDVITQREMFERLEIIRAEFARNNRKLPELGTLNRQVLEIMINESILVQEAKSRGIKITDSQLNQAMQKIASDNNLNLSKFRQLLIAEGHDYGKYRESIRQELMLNTLRRQYTARTVTVNDAEVDEFIKRSGGAGTAFEYKIAHILISLPDAASPEKVQQAQELAKQILQKLDAGAKFDQLANEYSTGSTALQGGDLGWRNKAEIPSLFTEIVVDLSPGQYAGPLRSASGYHIVYLSDRRDLEQVLTKQTRSRHILIKPNELISEEEARSRLEAIRTRILNGEDFGRLARLHSIDYTSGAEGGDIGWMAPGSTVPEYEAVTNRLEIGVLSEPFLSKFGWHIVEVTGRRTIDETIESKRNKIQSQLLNQKQNEAFDIWKKRLRDEAYVVLPNA